MAQTGAAMQKAVHDKLKRKPSQGLTLDPIRLPEYEARLRTLEENLDKKQRIEFRAIQDPEVKEMDIRVKELQKQSSELYYKKLHDLGYYDIKFDRDELDNLKRIIGKIKRMRLRQAAHKLLRLKAPGASI